MSNEAHISQLADISKHPAWALICDKFKRDHEAIRDASMGSDDDKKANELRVAYRMVKEFNPEKMRDTLFKIAVRQNNKDTPVQPMD